jgi:hypothetical protein
MLTFDSGMFLHSELVSSAGVGVIFVGVGVVI